MTGCVITECDWHNQIDFITTATIMHGDLCEKDGQSWKVYQSYSSFYIAWKYCKVANLA